MRRRSNEGILIILFCSDVSEDLKINDKKIHVSMMHVPSHLEAGNPASMGKTRSKQQLLKDGSFSIEEEGQNFGTSCLNIQVDLILSL